MITKQVITTYTSYSYWHLSLFLCVLCMGGNRNHIPTCPTRVTAVRGEVFTLAPTNDLILVLSCPEQGYSLKYLYIPSVTRETDKQLIWVNTQLKNPFTPLKLLIRNRRWKSLYANKFSCTGTTFSGLDTAFITVTESPPSCKNIHHTGNSL